MKRPMTLLWYCLLAWLVFASPIHAQIGMRSLGVDPKKPVSITSETGRTEKLDGALRLIFNRNVKVEWGEVTLHCDTFEVVYDERMAKTKRPPAGKNKKSDLRSLRGVRSMVASGNVKLVQKDVMATAGKAQFDSSKSTITLTEGPPRIWMGADVAVADTIVFYVKENRAELRGGGGGSRMQMKIHPGNTKK